MHGLYEAPQVSSSNHPTSSVIHVRLQRTGCCGNLLHGEPMRAYTLPLFRDFSHHDRAAQVSQASADERKRCYLIKFVKVLRFAVIYYPKFEISNFIITRGKTTRRLALLTI